MSVRHLSVSSFVGRSAVIVLAGLSVLGLSRTARADAKAALPAAVDTFKMTKPVQTFSPGTLENHIDGQAESVKKYDFKQCDYAEYAPGGAGNQLITVDIYEMGSPLDSYGYYSYQLAPSASRVKFIKVGAVEGYQTRDGISFWKGPYYVNVTITAANAPPNFQAEAPKIAQAIAAKLSGSQPLPPLLALLPPGRTPHSERYQRSDIISQAFLKNGVVANYPSAGTAGRAVYGAVSFGGRGKAGVWAVRRVSEQALDGSGRREAGSAQRRGRRRARHSHQVRRAGRDRHEGQVRRRRPQSQRPRQRPGPRDRRHRQSEIAISLFLVWKGQ